MTMVGRSLLALKGRAWTAVGNGATCGLLLVLAACGGGGASSGGGSGGGGGGGGGGPYTLGGTISGLGNNSGLVLVDSGTTLTVPAGATSFTFPNSYTAGTGYSVTVQASPAGLHCTVTSGYSGTLNANVTSVAVTCVAQSYTLGGTVTINGPTGVTLSDKGMVLTNTSNGDTYTFTANASSFTMPKKVAFGSSYAITVTTQPTGLTCTVNGGSGTMPASNVTTVAVSCSDQSFTVGGTIMGLGSASGLVLTNEGGDATTIAASATTFTMTTAVPYGAAYSIAVQSSPTNMSCTVTNGTGTMPAGNVTNVGIACGMESVLHSFGGTGDGSSPGASLIQGTDGYLYGLTTSGGAHGKGALFKISTSGVESVVYSFGATASDAANPYGSLVQASDGNFYGMAESGGASGYGAVFGITATGSEIMLYSFANSTSDGGNPYGGLIQASDGNLYGMTETGGSAGYGTVFKITTAGVETVLHSFASSSDGANPFGGLIQATDGNLYGTTHLGGANSAGTVFKITTAGVETVLHSFGASTDGIEPYGSLVQATNGSLYGTTVLGGKNSLGTVFKITTAGAETVLHSFGASGDGAKPYGNLIQASDGNLYGMTEIGGLNNLGAVFQITTAGAEAVFYSFGSSANDGTSPQGSLIQASNGAFYGLTPTGGANNLGVVFEIN